MIHVLPGDALAETFKVTDIEGEILICRECLIEGDVKADNLEDFWKIRAGFLANSFGEAEEKYYQGVVNEFQKLENVSLNSEICLWFEYELFCQVNMWFFLYLLHKTESNIYRVAPIVRKKEEIWKGFGGLAKRDLEKCFREKFEFTPEEKILGANLWKAYQASDYEMLEKLSETKSKCFPYLKEVCRAEIEKGFQPQRILEKILATGAKEFSEIFPAFSTQAGVYGFGDSQVKRVLERIKL